MKLRLPIFPASLLTLKNLAYRRLRQRVPATLQAMAADPESPPLTKR